MSQHHTGPSTSLVFALTEILRPLVRFLVHFQVTFPVLSQIIRRLYLEVAHNDFKLRDKRQTDSRIALLTGIHRKDIRRFREESHLPVSPPGRAALGAQVVAAWLSLPGYSDDHGEPLPIPRTASAAEPSFETLVANVSKQDVRARAVLDELVASGVVNIDTQGHVRLQRHAFVSEGDLDDKLYFFGRSLRDHISTSTANLWDTRSPQFDRGVYYNNLSAESLAKLRDIVDKLAMAMLKHINREARELQRKDALQMKNSPPVNTAELSRQPHRFHLGVFFHTEPQRTEDSDHDAPRN